MENTCWNTIGVGGDRTCPELPAVTHCQNCPVYSQGGRELLERPAPGDYIADWTASVAVPRNRQKESLDGTLSVAIFRLGQEWLALPAETIHQATNPKPVHSLPHRRDRVLRGIINVQGQLLLCVSLQELLGIPSSEASENGTSGNYQRAIAIRRQKEIWIFEVDEFYGLQRFPLDAPRNAPTLNSKILESFTLSILPWSDRHVSYLDADLLFVSLQNTL